MKYVVSDQNAKHLSEIKTRLQIIVSELEDIIIEETDRYLEMDGEPIDTWAMLRNHCMILDDVRNDINNTIAGLVLVV